MNFGDYESIFNDKNEEAGKTTMLHNNLNFDEIRNAFLHPSEEYTPIPFWFWNDLLTEKEIIRQIHDFNEKGVNGFVIHPRIGVPSEIEYLSDRFMELVLCAVREAKILGMKVVLYDEAMYPSGSAHGMVVKNHPEYASRGIKMLEFPWNQLPKIADLKKEGKILSVQSVRKTAENKIVPQSIHKVFIINNELRPENNEEDKYLLVFLEVFSGGHIRGIHFGEDDGQKNAPASADLLNKAAVEEFIHLTHDQYYEVLQEYFGSTIIGMFTDEPSILGRGHKKGLLSWSYDFLPYYLEHGNSELDLPLLWFESEDASVSEKVRRNFRETINQRMEEAYYRPISEWCVNHKIALTGHPAESDDIGFLKHFQIPTQDLVYRWVAPENELSLCGRNSTMGKCSSDSARHRNRRRNGNECFACCGKNKEWSFTVDDMKWFMDWLFVRGVNLLYPHAFFYSIEGERSGERPPDVGPNNLWWPYYKQISDYMKRMSYLMTDSVNQTRIAVLCESDHLPWQIVKPLYENQIEFNYLEKELFISEDCMMEENRLRICRQSYEVILIEDPQFIDKATDEKLQRFLDAGGKVFVYLSEADQKEGQETRISAPSLRQAIRITSYDEVIEQLDRILLRDIRLLNANRNIRVSHVKKEGLNLYLFVNEGEENITTEVTLGTYGSVELWNAWDASIKNCSSIKAEKNQVTIPLTLNRRETLIVAIDETGKSEISTEVIRWKEEELITLNEPWYLGTEVDNIKKLDTLVLWNEIEEYECYSGTLCYQTKFSLPLPKEEQRMELEFTKAHELVRVFVNGKEAGMKMWSPYLFDITDIVKEGENELLVEVTNSIANRMYQQNLPSGLGQNVIIHRYKRI